MTEDVIGANLRNLRNTAGISLSRAADLTGVSKAMLGQIERGESSPTIATLWKIAKGFHLPLSALIGAPEAGRPDPAVAFRTVQFPGSIAVKMIFPFDPDLGAETFQISLTPGQAHVSQPHESGVTEEVFVLEGKMEVLRDDVWQALGVGEGVRFRADQPHGYRGGAEGAVFLNMHHYPRHVGNAELA
ncbi:helix-turn-helix domain-containing protein [Pseudophaeobacter arcticus]|uniref:helix-turn-helix domain-containing protein n=1 Tax=Pseudophaeobacter arcticus TaxID=385492 RepID=UPI003A970429